MNVYENIVLSVELDGNTVDKRFMNGGQQRVAIARALISKSAIVLADRIIRIEDGRISG